MDLEDTGFLFGMFGGPALAVGGLIYIISQTTISPTPKDYDCHLLPFFALMVPSSYVGSKVGGYIGRFFDGILERIQERIQDRKDLKRRYPSIFDK